MRMVSNHNANFEEAERLCRSTHERSHLVDVDTGEKRAAIEAMARRHACELY